jgi:hypothetical protein
MNEFINSMISIVEEEIKLNQGKIRLLLKEINHLRSQQELAAKESTVPAFSEIELHSREIASIFQKQWKMIDLYVRFSALLSGDIMMSKHKINLLQSLLQKMLVFFQEEENYEQCVQVKYYLDILLHEKAMP